MLRPHDNPILKPSVKTIRPDGFAAPHVFRDEKSGKVDMKRLFRHQSAEEFVGELNPGCHMFGLSKGQFSMIDVIRVITDQIGKCDLSMSTWTVASADLGELQDMIAERFSSVRFLLDFSFQRRQPGLIAEIRKRFGAQAVVVTKNHCKFALFRAGDWRIVVRTSMNLNFNPRIEDIEIKDDPDLYAFLDEILTEIFDGHDQKGQADKGVAALSGEFKELKL